MDWSIPTHTYMGHMYKSQSFWTNFQKSDDFLLHNSLAYFNIFIKYFKNHLVTVAFKTYFQKSDNFSYAGN